MVVRPPVNPLRLYHRLKEECLSDFERRLKVYEDYAEDEEEREEIREVCECALDFLDKYAKLSAGAMDDYEVHEFYRQTVKMLERAIETKKLQYEIARDRLDDIEKMLKDEEAVVCDKSSEMYNEHECEVVRERLSTVESFRRLLERAEKEDISVMEARLEACRVADTRAEKVLCIDSVAGLIHARGSILPLMCGAPLSEFVDEAVFGEDVEIVERGVHVVAVDMAKDVMDVLSCIANFRVSLDQR